MNKLLPFVSRTAGLFVMATSVAMAQEVSEGQGWMGIGAGLGIGLAALGGGLSQGRTASAALEGMARNPAAADKLNTPMLIALVLTETLVLFAFAVTAKLAGLI